MRGRDPETKRPIDVLCIGETMALVVPAAAEPVENATDFRLEVGGAESNVACHLAAAGRRSEWFSALGDDALGRRTLARVAEHGVATGVPTGAPGRRECWTVDRKIAGERPLSSAAARSCCGEGDVGMFSEVRLGAGCSWIPKGHGPYVQPCGNGCKRRLAAPGRLP